MGSRIECVCGNIISTGSFPDADVYRLISEVAYDQVEDPFDRLKAEQIFVAAKKVIWCPICDRIMIQQGVNVVSYIKESS